METKIKSLESNLEEQNKRNEELLSKYQDLEEKSKEQLGQLSEQILNYQEGTNLLEEQNSNLREKLQETLERAKKATEESQELQTNLMKTQGQLQNVQQQLIEVSTKSAEYKTLAETTKKDLDNTQSIMEKTQDQTKKIMEKLREIASQKKDLEVKLEESKAVPKASPEEIEEYKKKLADAENTIKTIGSTADEERTRMKNLEKEMESLKAAPQGGSNQSLVAELNDKIDQVKKLQSFMMELKKENESLKEKLGIKSDSKPSPMGQGYQEQNEPEIYGYVKPKLKSHQDIGAPMGQSTFGSVERSSFGGFQRSDEDESSQFGMQGSHGMGQGFGGQMGSGNKMEPMGQPKMGMGMEKEPQAPKPSNSPMRYMEQTPPAPDYSAEAEDGDDGDTQRLLCPKCKGSRIVEMEDKSQVLAFTPRIIYGTKYRCQSCRHEWA